MITVLVLNFSSLSISPLLCPPSAQWLALGECKHILMLAQARPIWGGERATIFLNKDDVVCCWQLSVLCPLLSPCSEVERVFHVGLKLLCLG